MKRKRERERERAKVKLQSIILQEMKLLYYYISIILAIPSIFFLNSLVVESIKSSSLSGKGVCSAP